MDEVEHLRQRHDAAMRRLERTTERDARKRRKHMERFDRAYILLRERIGVAPDPGTPGPPRTTARLFAGFMGVLRSFLF